MKRRIDKIFVCIFIFVLVLPMLFMNFNPNKISATENRPLTKFPSIITQDGEISNTLFNDLNLWANDNVGFRELFVNLNAIISYNLFNVSPNDRVVMGNDGWFFYNQDKNIQISNGKYILDDETLEKIKIEQLRIKDYLEKQGVQYILVLTPSKASIYPEKIENINKIEHHTIIDQVEEYLTKNTDIKVINTKKALLEEKAINPDKLLYFKTDTHWNDYGAYIAYKHIENKLLQWKVGDRSNKKVEFFESEYKGEFSSMMGNVNLLASEKTFEGKVLNSNVKDVYDEELAKKIDVYQQGHNRAYGVDQYYDNAVNKKNVLIYGDSFFGKWNIIPLLSENFKSTHFVWSDKVIPKTVDEIKPDVIIFERTERYIENLKDKTKIEYLSEHDAEIVSHNAPTEIIKGKKYNIDITVKNVTNETWSADKEVKLCIWQEGLDKGHRVNIPDGKEIKPGEEFIFKLTDYEVPKEGESYIEFQMLEEGITYFGEKERVNIK